MARRRKSKKIKLNASELALINIGVGLLKLAAVLSIVWIMFDAALGVHLHLNLEDLKKQYHEIQTCRALSA